MTRLIAALLLSSCSFETGGFEDLAGTTLWAIRCCTDDPEVCYGGEGERIEPGTTSEMGHGWTCLVGELDQNTKEAEVSCWRGEEDLVATVQCGGEEFSRQVGSCGVLVQCRQSLGN